MHTWDYNNKLSFNSIVEQCPKDPYQCYLKEYREYMGLVGLTGLSIGLKKSFNFLDELKQYQTQGRTDLPEEIPLEYALYYLEINNIALSQTLRRYHGYDFMRGGNYSSYRDFFKKSFAFADELVLEIDKMPYLFQYDGPSELSLMKKKKELISEYQLLKKNKQQQLENEIAAFIKEKESASNK